MACECIETHDTSYARSLHDLRKPDDDHEEAWFFQCENCGRVWLRVLFVVAPYSGSGHWFDALTPSGFDTRAFVGSKENVDRLFEASLSCSRGGSYFAGRVSRFKGIPRSVMSLR